MHLHLDLVFYLLISALFVAPVLLAIAFSDRLNRLPRWGKSLMLLVMFGVVLYGYYAYISWYMSRVTEAENFDPLIQAVDSGDLQKFELLMPRNASASANGEAVLVEAARRGQAEIVRELLDRGVDVNVREGWHLEDVRTDCCVFAYMGGEPKDPPPPDTVVKAPRRGSLYANGEYSNSRVSTPLIEAARNGHVDVIRLLLGRGADVNGKGEHGSTALMGAMGVGCVSESVRLLLDKGAEVNARDEDGDTALMYAVRDATPLGCFRLLFDAGAEVNARNKSSAEPLLVAVKKGETTLENVKLLLDRGADPNAKDDDGSTALMYAVRRYGLETTLLETDSAVNLLMKEAEFRLACARLLLDQEADIHGPKEEDVQRALYGMQHHEEWQRNTQRDFWLLACETSYVEADEHRSHATSERAHRYCSGVLEQRQ